ncbi:uncharacterized protein LOC142590149 isoform X2 [Dermacentor variabilis]|uniref:uncharacterized protein LOC142590149 isoform X2 n=1 Tax=Dermacentor variabilis TaxID=34621 RepID=UPI003F5B51CE
MALRLYTRTTQKGSFAIFCQLSEAPPGGKEERPWKRRHGVKHAASGHGFARATARHGHQARRHLNRRQQVMQALRIADRRRGGGAASKPRHLLPTVGSSSGREKSATVASSKRRHGVKHAASGHGFARATAGHGHQARRHLNRRQQGKHNIGGFERPADLPSRLHKQFTPKALEGMLERFAQCSQANLPMFKLLRKDLVADLARVTLREDSPWLGLVDDTAGAPKLEAVDKFASPWSVLNIGQNLKKQLNVFKSRIDVTELKKLSTAVNGTNEWHQCDVNSIFRGCVCFALYDAEKMGFIY